MSEIPKGFEHIMGLISNFEQSNYQQNPYKIVELTLIPPTVKNDKGKVISQQNLIKYPYE